MNTQKTLLAILVEYLPKNGGWPHATTSIGQDYDRELMFFGRGCVRTGIILDDLAIDHRKRFHSGVKITRDQYESALAASKEPLTGTGVDGWIDWAGGECPVDHMQAVEVRYRDGTIKPAAPAFHYLWTNGYGDCKTTDADIVAYRLHQPQDANSRANDDRLAQHAAAHAGFASTSRDEETDLNDCIGQAPGAPQWDGQGLPPVGVEFNYGSHRSRAKCLAVGLHYVFASKGNPDDEEGDYEELMIDAQTEFHPVHEDSDQMMRDIMKSSCVGAAAAVQIANQLIAAGYRKQ